MHPQTPPGDRIRVTEDDVESRVDIAPVPLGGDALMLILVPALVFGMQTLFVMEIAFPSLLRAVVSVEVARVFGAGWLPPVTAGGVALGILLLQLDRIRQRESVAIGANRATVHRDREWMSQRIPLALDAVTGVELARPAPFDELLLARARPGGAERSRAARDAPIHVLRILAGTTSVDIGATLTETELEWLVVWMRERIARWSERDDSRADDPTRPPGHRIRVADRSPDSIVFAIRRRGLPRGEWPGVLLTLIGCVLWLGFAPWREAVPGLRRGDPFWLGPLAIALTPVLGWLGIFLNRTFGAERIELTRERLSIRRRRPFFPRTTRVRIDEIRAIELDGDPAPSSPIETPSRWRGSRRAAPHVMRPAIRTTRAATHVGESLTEGEMRWLVSALARAVERVGAASGNPGEADGDER